jgi:hypothetical protein
LVTNVKPNRNSVEVHPQQSNKGHPSSGWCAGGCCWFIVVATRTKKEEQIPERTKKDVIQEKKKTLNDATK